MEDENILVRQYGNYKTYADRLDKLYLLLCIKRIQKKNLTRDEYMMYDLFDALIPLISALDEVVDKEKPFPGYVVEKLKSVKSYVDTTYEYFLERSNKSES